MNRIFLVDRKHPVLVGQEDVLHYPLQHDLLVHAVVPPVPHEVLQGDGEVPVGIIGVEFVFREELARPQVPGQV